MQTTIEAHPSRRMPLIAIAVASVVAIALIVIAGAEQADRKQDFSYETLIDEPTAPVLDRDSAAATAPPDRTSDTAQSTDLMGPENPNSN